MERELSDSSMDDPLEILGSETVGAAATAKDDLFMEVDGASALRENAATAEDWRKALDKVVPAVVVLRTTAPRAFDTYAAGSFHATGFVVDKRRGIILTNRHVVRPGPVVAEAMFVNREEVPVHPIYRDPVHDFGFFQYEPSAIQFLNYEEIPLAPEAASVGLEIRVVGNDSREKVSILAGTLARLDRDAPNYRKDGYNDFNTFYIQAASGTKGGSSGSPVIDWQGRAVALNAGGRRSSASAFFLPLERVVRALKFLQKGKNSFKDKWEAVSIPRGTLQVTFLHKGFNDTRRLGLQTGTEQMVRQASPPEETGMLVVDSVVPGGPAHKRLEPGDVLVRMNGEVITRFLKMEVLLDDFVDQKIELLIERGGTPVNLNLRVQDLHLVSPDHFLEVSGAVIHPLSYQQARNFQFQCGLVYVAEPGYMFYRAGVPRHAIIKKFAGVDIAVLEDLITALSKLHRGARIPLEYVSYKNRHHGKSKLVTVDRHEWYAAPQIYTRNDSDGLWTLKPAFQPLHLLLTYHVNEIQRASRNHTLLSFGEANLIEQIHRERIQELIDGVKLIGICEDHSCEDSHAQGELGTGKKKWCVEEDSSTDGALAEYSFHIGREIEMKNTRNVENAAIMTDCHGPISRPANASYAEHVIEPTLVMIEVHVPPSSMVDGVHSKHFSGTGVIVYHSQDMGLIAVDKNTVAVSVSDVMLSFAAFPIEIPGEVVFLHPVHNYALVAYDPSALGPVGASVVRAAELLPEPALQRGDSVYLVGLSKSLRAISRKSVVTNPCAAIGIGSASCPRYRAINTEVIELDTDFGSAFSGVLTDEQGQVQAIWGSFSAQVSTFRKKKLKHPKNHQFVRGIPVYNICQAVEKIVSGAKGPSLLINGIKRPMPLVRILEVELFPRLLSKARSFGLSDEWVQALVKKDPLRRQVLCVKGCLAGSKAENLLEHGDMVLAINGEPITCFQDVESACQALDNDDNDNGGKLKMTIFRQGHKIDVLVGTDVRDGSGTTRVVNWCGCIVQDPHPAVRAVGFLPQEGHGVYVARCSLGSPVQRYGLCALQWIVEIDGEPTPDLDAFVRVTKEQEHGQFVRVRTVQLNGKPQVLTLKQDLHYWPTWELRFDPDTAMWQRKIIRAS